MEPTIHIEYGNGTIHFDYAITLQIDYYNTRDAFKPTFFELEPNFQK